MPKRLTKAELLKPKLTTLDVDGRSITIRALSAAYAIGLKGQNLGDAAIFDMLAKSICDEAGAPILTADEVGQIPVKTLGEIVAGVMAFNSMDAGAVQIAAEELKKTETETEDLITTLHERLEAEGL